MSEFIQGFWSVINSTVSGELFGYLFIVMLVIATPSLLIGLLMLLVYIIQGELL